MADATPFLETRLRWVRWLSCLGLLLGVLLSTRLWFGPRSFPEIPAIGFVPSLPPTLTAGLAALWVLFVLAFAVRGRRWIFFVGLGCLVALCLFDITRLQPWVYGYVLMLGCLALPDKGRWPVGLFVLTGIYFWSGVQKLNPAFATEIFPWLTKGIAGASMPAWLGYLAGALEATAGVLLLFPRSRMVGAVGLSLMHASILLALGPLGHNFNSVVWPWNAILPAVTLLMCVSNRASIQIDAFRCPSSMALALLAGAVPVLSFAGLWDDHLSFSLYAGRSRDALLRFPDGSRLPAEIPTSATRRGPIVDVAAWALHDLDVPPYPEPRAFRALAARYPTATLYIRKRNTLGGATREFLRDQP